MLKPDLNLRSCEMLHLSGMSFSVNKDFCRRCLRTSRGLAANRHFGINMNNTLKTLFRSWVMCWCVETSINGGFRLISFVREFYLFAFHGTFAEGEQKPFTWSHMELKHPHIATNTADEP